MARRFRSNPRARLVYHVQELERLEALKDEANQDLRNGFSAAEAEGYDKATLKVVLKLRKMTPHQRRERRALESIYMAALGMLEGDSLPDVARKRLDGLDEPDETTKRDPDDLEEDAAPAPAEAPPQPSPAPPEQPPLIMKDPGEARTEGAQAAADGKRIYDNPYPAGDPCRAAWDEGWCGHQQSHGMETPPAYRRRTEPKPKDRAGGEQEADQGHGDSKRGAA